jgi:hypothetical protein
MTLDESVHKVTLHARGHCKRLSNLSNGDGQSAPPKLGQRENEQRHSARRRVELRAADDH